MRQYLLGALSLAAFAAMAAPASADTDTYAVARIGVGDANVEGLSFQDVDTFGAALGLEFESGLRLEAGVDRTSGTFFGVAEGTVIAYSATAEFDFNRRGSFQPYVGIGADYAEGEVDLGFASIEDSGTGWHWDVGVRVPITEKLELEGQRRQTTLDFDVGEVETVNYTFGLVAHF